MTQSVPFIGCWWATNRLLGGPAFFAGSEPEVREKVDALENCGITGIASLVAFHELHPTTEASESLALEIASRFLWCTCPVANGDVPSRQAAKSLLDCIDVGLTENGKVFVHCLAGRGRSGTIIGAWLARHGLAQGKAVIDHLERCREAAALSIPCPETEEQRALVRNWKKGD